VEFPQKLKNFLNFKIKNRTPIDPAIPLRSKYQKETNSAYYGDICIPMFILSLFTIVKLWNQPRWIKENMEFTQLLRRIKSCHLENG
jgi:hypothetical protein